MAPLPLTSPHRLLGRRRPWEGKYVSPEPLGMPWESAPVQHSQMLWLFLVIWELSFLVFGARPEKEGCLSFPLKAPLFPKSSRLDFSADSSLYPCAGFSHSSQSKTMGSFGLSFTWSRHWRGSCRFALRCNDYRLDVSFNFIYSLSILSLTFLHHPPKEQ